MFRVSSDSDMARVGSKDRLFATSRVSDSDMALVGSKNRLFATSRVSDSNMALSQ